jgi:hypothetical protein
LTTITETLKSYSKDFRIIPKELEKRTLKANDITKTVKVSRQEGLEE